MATDFFSKQDVQKLLDAEDKAVQLFVVKLKSKIERQLNAIAKNLDKSQGILEITKELNKLSAINFPPEVEKELDKYINLYQNSLKNVSEAIKTTNGIKEVFNKEDNLIIDKIFQFNKAKIISSVDQTYAQFKSVAFQTLISSELPDLSSVIQATTDNLESRLPTEINTQLAGFQSAVTVKKADDLGLTHFLYAGGLIKTSRQFCIERAGKIFSFEEAKSWNDELELDFLIYRGGYNCRHAIVPMTESKAIQEGWVG